MKADRPTGVTAVAVVFLLVAVYLLGVALAMLVKPGLISMAAGADLLSGLEIAGPFMFRLIAAVGGAVGAGLLRLHNWARRAAMVVAMIGIALLLPSVSSSAIDFRVTQLAWSGLGVILRAAILWYLFQAPIKEVFETKVTAH